MKKIFFRNFLSLIVGLILASIFYTHSSFANGNKADIIEIPIRIGFFFCLSLICLILDIIFVYLIKIKKNVSFFISMLTIFLLGVFSFAITKESEMVQYFIYFPVFTTVEVIAYFILNIFDNKPQS